jgi:hypothetical protein
LDGLFITSGKKKARVRGENVTLELGSCVFLSRRIKKVERGKKMSRQNYDEKKIQGRATINTQHVPLRQNAEEKGREKDFPVSHDLTRQGVLGRCQNLS